MFFFFFIKLGLDWTCRIISKVFLMPLLKVQPFFNIQGSCISKMQGLGFLKLLSLDDMVLNLLKLPVLVFLCLKPWR